MTGKDVKRQVMEALTHLEGSWESAAEEDGAEAYAALAPCTVLTPEERAIRESKIARARGLAESLTLNLGPYREGSIAEIGAEIAALLSPNEAGDE